MPEPRPTQVGRYPLHPDGRRNPGFRDNLDDLSDAAVTRRRHGDPNFRGRLPIPTGFFALRADLTAPGAITMTEAVEVVVTEWERQRDLGVVTDAIVTIYTRSMRALALIMVSRGLTRVDEVTPNVLLMWCLMPKQGGQAVADNTSRARRSAARAFFDTAHVLGLTDLNPAKSVAFPDRKPRYVRPVTDAQIAHIQRTCRLTVDDTRHPASFALMMSGASSNEFIHTRVEDVDLTNGRVWTHDGGYRSHDRWIPLYDDWCVAAVARRLAAVRAQTGAATGDDIAKAWLLHQPHPTRSNPARQGNAGNQLITRVLHATGLWQPGLTRAESIREWLAIKVFEETGSVGQVAERLGMSSLDGAAHLVDYDWLNDLALAPPPVHAHRRQPTMDPRSASGTGEDQ
jgi:integrase/recombinase XerC